MNMVIERISVCTFTMLLLCGYSHGYQCHPNQGDPVCSSCVNDTAVCSAACIGNSSYSRTYLQQICPAHEYVIIRNVDLSFNSLLHLDCSSTSSLKLRKLNMSYNNITIHECDYWEMNCYNTFKHLEYIDLSFNRIDNYCNASAFPLNKLKHVNLSHNQVTSLDNLPFFSSANNIHVVDLSHNHISYLSWDSFLHKPHLIAVNISYNNFQQCFTCNGILRNVTGFFHISIYESSVSNGTVTSSGSHRQFTNGRSCAVSVYEAHRNASSCHEDVRYNFSDNGLWYYPLNGSKTLGRFDLNGCIYKLNISCYLIEVDSTPVTLSDVPTTQGQASLVADTTSTKNTPVLNSVATQNVTDLSKLHVLMPIAFSSIVLSLCLLFAVCLFSLKLLQIVKDRLYSQSPRYDVSSEIYTELNTQLRNVTNVLDFSDGVTLTRGTLTRQECYTEIPELGGSSSLPYSPREANHPDVSVDTYDAPDVFEGYHLITTGTSSNAECTINTLEIPFSQRWTENTGESVSCYNTIASSNEDIDKDGYDMRPSPHAIRENDSISQGSHLYESPFLEGMLDSPKVAKESTSEIMEASAGNENCFTNNMKVGRLKSKDLRVSENVSSCDGSGSLEMIENSCYLERIDDMDQNSAMKDDALSRHKSKSLDMIMNPCYLEVDDNMNHNILLGEDSLNTSKIGSLDMLTNPCYAPV